MKRASEGSEALVRRPVRGRLYRAISCGADFFLPQVLGQTQVVNWATAGAGGVAGATLHVLGHTPGRDWGVFGAGGGVKSGGGKKKFII